MLFDFAKIWAVGITFTFALQQANFVSAPSITFPISFAQNTPQTGQILATHTISLTDRYPNKSVSKVFQDNILLTLHYMRGDNINPRAINWNTIESSFHYEFTLTPYQMFAFHDGIFPEYNGLVVKTTNAHFNAQEGFKSDGYLYGDGVCHLASLMNWVAQDAHLKVDAPTNHDFAKIPDIDKTYGTAIYYAPEKLGTSEKNNLYITNTYPKPITLTFDYQNNNLRFSISEAK